MVNNVCTDTKRSLFQEPTLGKTNQFFCNICCNQYFNESTENFNLNLQLTLKHFSISQLIVLAFFFLLLLLVLFFKKHYVLPDQHQMTD